MAPLAITAALKQIRNDTFADKIRSLRSFNYHAAPLVTRNQRELDVFHSPADQGDVAAANSAIVHANQRVTGGRFGQGYVLYGKFVGRANNYSFHRLHETSILAS